MKLIAFYLPQFHPIPENNGWWGKGFTEWRNVAKAKPLFPGHYQPHLPADLGFYDLRLPETRIAQAELASSYGIHGFCYYHYWFNGKRLLERPFNDVLESGKPDFPFCLAWANETWTRRWDGMDQEILMPQDYGGEEDDQSHIKWLIKAFSDDRYIKIENKPLFLIYRGDKLPDPKRTIELWRNEVRKSGFPDIYLVSIETSFHPGWKPINFGFDASLLFQPQFYKALDYPAKVSLTQKLIDKLKGNESISYYNYKEVWPLLDNHKDVEYRRYYTVCPGWDNTARKGNNDPFILHNSTPEEYGKWLNKAVRRVQNDPPKHRIVFINAWNEWAEGNHLEPDMKYGKGYLEETLNALKSI
jgi:lipopolysaccharide biosynthesis protein